MNTFLTTSLDGTQIAYDHIGTGPALILLHGGGSSRQDWHDEGYVKHLQENFTVITLDLRGHGESDLPTGPADYAIDKMMQDILAVADVCGVERFTIWGFSFGGRIGRYLAAQSGRVDKIILMCTPWDREYRESFARKSNLSAHTGLRSCKLVAPVPWISTLSPRMTGSCWVIKIFR